jgi:hypothetical protein
VAEKAAAAEPEALEPMAEGEARCGLDMLQPPSQEDSGEPRSSPREAPSKGMCKRGPEAPLSPPRDSPPEGKRRPQRGPQETPRVGVLALQESASTVLKCASGATPGFLGEDPSWCIEGEP